MDFAEIRVLEGPNLFLLRPAIKIEVVLTDDERRLLPGRLGAAGQSIDEAWQTFIRRAAGSAAMPPPETVVYQVDDADHLALVFSWDHRPAAEALAEVARATIQGAPVDEPGIADRLRSAAAAPADPPTWVRDTDRRGVSIAVTGTNGKTTTTRLLAHIARTAGRRVGWSSSSGVYVDGELIEAGDYSGPSGAGQVLAQGVDLAILETARGGILLKGLGYESNDVSVFTNVSGDHLGLHGVHTVETLAKVKSVVCRVTRAEGVAVVNADDPLVMAETADIRAERWLFCRAEGNPAVDALRGAGGTTIVLDASEEAIVARRGDDRLLAIAIGDLPVCFGGRAVHMVENVMAAVGGALAAGIAPDAVRAGATTFGTEPDHNPGRLNVIEVGGYTVVLDYAHNEAGLTRLLEFGRGFVRGDGRLVAVIGSAGDREPTLLRALGTLAAQNADHVVAKGTERYLRGTDRDDLMALYRSGAASFPDTPYEEVEDEWAAVRLIPEMARPGDVFVLMFQELIDEVKGMLEEASAR